MPTVDLLTPPDIRALAARLDLRPHKSWGQNFVVDPGTARRIARLADAALNRASSSSADGAVPPTSIVEVGPGLGSLTLALLETGAQVTAIEVDPVLAAALPATVAERAGDLAANLTVITADALKVVELPDPQPRALVANLPYNVAVPVLLEFLERFGTLERVLVMVQAEVADRVVAAPGSRVYGVPSLKVAWYAQARRAGTVARSVFWPVPRVDSALVALERRPPPGPPQARAAVFAAIDAAFAQRRKTLRAALAGWAGSAARAAELLAAAGIDPQARGETLDIAAFTRLAEASQDSS